MARLLTFRSMVAESLEKNDSLGFQDIMRNKLEEIFKEKKQKLLISVVEEIDPEMAMVTNVQTKAKAFGGCDVSYDEGVLIVDVPCGQPSNDFGKWLDSLDTVDSYEIEVMNSDYVNPDLENADVSDNNLCQFTIYFVTDNVQFEDVVVSETPLTEIKKCDEGDMEDDDDEDDMEDDDDDDDDEEEMNEAEKVVTFLQGLKKIKMRCPPGQKWSPGKKKCVKMDAAENRRRHINAIKSAKKRAPKLDIIAKRRARSLKKRKAAGY